MPNPNSNSRPFSLFQNCPRAALAFPLILLAACGGGDDSDSASTTSSNCLKTHAGDCLTNTELAARARQVTGALRTAIRSVPGGSDNWARDQVNAYGAYANLNIVKGVAAGAAPGQGVHIGILDTGIDLNHPDFTGVGSGSRKLQDGAAQLPSFSETHGTSVASSAVGFTSGIAWGADMTMFSAKNPDPERAFVPLTTDLYQGALNEDLDILNMSLGYGPGTIGGIQVGAIQSSLTESKVRNFYGSNRLNVWAQRGVSEKTIMVWSAGNNNSSSFNAHSPSINGGAVRFIPELRGHWVTVVATDQSGTIANFSNRCGLAAQWCIAAPGERVRAASYRPSGANTDLYQYANGTSFSAPMVSGGLAVMKQMFRGQLSNTALVTRLFQTAKKSGIHANAAIYGQGLMDLGAATNPWGTPAFMGTGSSLANADGASIANSFVSLGSPLGDGLPQSLNQQEVTAFDELGAPFWLPAASFTVPSQGTSISTRLNHFLAPYQPRSLPQSWTLDFKPDAFAGEGGHLALTHGASRLTMAGPNGFAATAFHHPSDNNNQSPLTGLALSWTPAPFPDFNLQAGVLDEQNSLLGSQASGAFGQLSGQTLFLSAGLDTTMPWDWQLAAQGELGVVSPSVGSSQFINHISPLSTSAFRLQASKTLPNGGSFRLSLAQPLRVDSGAADLSLPTGRTQEGIVLGQDLSASLVPSGRQLDLTAMVELPLAEETTLSLGATRSQQPQHQQTADAEWTLFTGWRTKW